MQSNSSQESLSIPRPSLFLHISELWRAFWEFRQGKKYITSVQYQNIGNGHPILVIPGLTASPWSTHLLRDFLNNSGFNALDWGLGRNLGNLADVFQLEHKIEDICNNYSQKVTVLGWSLGGIYARRLGQVQHNKIQQVITLGAPYRHIRSPNYAAWFFNLMQRIRGIEEPEWSANLHLPLEVPTIAYYSKKDGIVPWQACHDPQDVHDHINIEVSTSHFGMGASDQVFQSLLNVLNMESAHRSSIVLSSTA